MKQLYFILAVVAILAGCQPQEEVSKSHGIKEVYLVQFRYYFDEYFIEDYNYTEGDILEPKLKLVGYTSLEPNSGQMEVWDGFFDDSISHHSHGHAPKTALATALVHFSQQKEDQFYYHNRENSDEMIPMYSGSSLFFQVIKEDETAYTIGFVPYKLPKELEGLYRAMKFRSGVLSDGQPVNNALSTLEKNFLEVINTKLYVSANIPPSPDLPPPPPPVRVSVEYTPLVVEN